MCSHWQCCLGRIDERCVLAWVPPFCPAGAGPEAWPVSPALRVAHAQVACAGVCTAQAPGSEWPKCYKPQHLPVIIELSYHHKMLQRDTHVMPFEVAQGDARSTMGC